MRPTSSTRSSGKRDIFCGAPGRHRDQKIGPVAHAELQALRMRRTSAASRTRPSLRPSQSRSRATGGAVCSSADRSASPPANRIPGDTSGNNSSARASARDRVVRVLRFLEPHGSVGAKLQRRRRFADARRLEIRAFKNDGRGRRGDCAVASADHAGDRDGTRSIGNYQIGRSQIVFFIVQRGDPFAGARGRGRRSCRR